MARPKSYPLRFNQTEVERAIRGVQRQGLAIARVEIDPVNSRISIVTEKLGSSDDGKNPWDSVLAHGKR
jgi:hypothetical protein